MNRYLSLAAFLLGLGAVGWVGSGYLGTSPLALLMTAVIGAVYLAGAIELRRFHQVTAGLRRALAAVPSGLTQLDEWLGRLPASLHNPVRLRIEGERVGLPGPTLTPYLVGLLVLLGMLGTFLGMVVTLKGAVIALESTTDLQAVRTALAAPVKGLGLAFGTSVAGVAASAMLGLMAAVCRRERLQATQLLDTRIAADLRPFSRTHQREEAFKALRAQAGLMPELVDRLQAMMGKLAQQDQAMNAQLLDNQERFHQQTEAVYAGLANSVDRSLKATLVESARQAGALIQPVVEATMKSLAQEAGALHEKMADTAQVQLEQVKVMPQLVERLQAMMTQLEGQGQALNGQLLESQERFHQQTESVYQGLANSVDRSLQTSLSESARQAGALIQPVVEATMKSLAQEAGALHEKMADTAQVQLEQVKVMPQLVDQLKAMMARLEGQGQALNGQLVDSQQRFHQQTETVYAGLASSIDQSLKDSLTESARLAGALIQPVVEATMKNLAQEAGALHEKMSDTAQVQLEQVKVMPQLVDRLQAMAGRLEAQGQALNGQLLDSQQRFHLQTEAVYGALVVSVDKSLKDSLDQSVRLASDSIQPVVEATLQGLAKEAGALHAQVAGTVQQQLDGLATRFDGAVSEVSAGWAAALARHERSSERLSEGAHGAMTALAAGFEQQLAGLLERVGQSHEAQRDASVAQDQQRLSTWTASLASIAATLRQEWQQAGAQGVDQQAQICRTLEQTARDITEQTRAQASQTIAEMAQLMQAAAEAPQAAAEAMGQLRRQLSDSMARDNELLEERGRILSTVSSVLDALHSTSTEQRGAIDALVSSSAALLERIGSELTERIGSQTEALTEVAAYVSGGAVEVASLGEAFGVAVQQFSESNDRLAGNLQRIEGSLDNAMLRSDEQLAYYVAQAREIIDLSLLSQKKIVDELQRFAQRQGAAAAVEAAAGQT